MQPILIIHGGAGDIPDDREPGKLNGIKKTLRDAYKILVSGGSSLDAVEAAINSMERDENFNSGYGSDLNIDGVVAMDASIMEGKDLKGGCVTLLSDVLHPISLARKVMEKTNHNFIGGDSLLDFARKHDFEVLPKGSLVSEHAKLALEEFKERQRLQQHKTKIHTTHKPKRDLGETCGAVAIDADGNIAAGTSTGGVTGKMSGRIADTSILGCGTYADNKIGGVSSTGHGETIMRYNLSQRILQEMHFKQVTAQKATEDVTNEMTDRLTGLGGAITIDKEGGIGIYFTSPRMPWGYVKDGQIIYGIKNCGFDKFKEDL